MTDDAKGPTKVPKMKAVGQDIFEDNGCGNHIGRIGLHGRTEKEAMDIAAILAQAGTLYAETGMTPREMMAEIARLRGIIAGRTEQRMDDSTIYEASGDVKATLSPDKKEPKP